MVLMCFFFISVVRKGLCFVSTDVLIIKMPCSTKPISGVARIAIIFVVTKDTNSCCATRCRRFKILLVTICLQRCLLDNQLFPRITTQWRRAVCTPSAIKEYIERVGVFVDGDLINFMTDLHSEADLGGGSSRKAIWSLDGQAGSFLLEDWSHFCWSTASNRSESFSEYRKRWIYDKTSEIIVNLPWKF